MEVAIVEAERGQPPGPFILDEQVGVLDEALEQAAPTRLIEVKRDALLARVVVPEPQAAVRARLVLGEGRVLRVGSPVGGSTFTTSAPMSASSFPAHAPCS